MVVKLAICMCYLVRKDVWLLGIMKYSWLDCLSDLLYNSSEVTAVDGLIEGPNSNGVLVFACTIVNVFKNWPV